MAITLSGSVGRNGINQHDDVVAVQQALNAVTGRIGIAPLPVNGAVDSQLLAAIEELQRRVLDQRSPDGRIDPRGRTVRALEAAMGSETSAADLKNMITYHKDVPEERRIASDYALRVIERALTTAGMKAAMITSTLRLPAEQAEIMYRMAKKDIQEQFRLYGATGDEVIKVFKTHQDKPKDEVVELMRQKIEDLADRGKRVSLHVVSFEQYKRLNVIDLGMNSTASVAGSTFTPKSKAALTAAFEKLKRQGYLANFIDETAKPNKCWHVEVVPNAKPLQ